MNRYYIQSKFCLGNSTEDTFDQIDQETLDLLEAGKLDVSQMDQVKPVKVNNILFEFTLFIMLFYSFPFPSFHLFHFSLRTWFLIFPQQPTQDCIFHIIYPLKMVSKKLYAVTDWAIRGHMNLVLKENWNDTIVDGRT